MPNGIPVGLPNRSLVACQTHIFPLLRNKALLSIGKLFNDGFSVVFDQQHVTAFKDNQLFLSRNPNYNNGLYYIDLPPTLYPTSTRTVAPSCPLTASTHIKNCSAYKMTTQANIFQFLHHARTYFALESLSCHFHWNYTNS